ncbi:MAG: DUF3137 domain-containing protein [Pelagimonas sp.]|uniref:DUF3137 domain-containing protein n=1 Tax=Pelagimonas sp. TaxID=2073170 RepID=UPI003D6C54A6
MDFIERHPIENGFAEVFYDRIEPELNMLESQRLAMLANGKRKFLVWAGVGLALAAGAYANLPGHDLQWVSVGVAILGGLGVGAMARSAATKSWGSSISNVVMPPICDFLGDTRYDRRAQNGFSLGRLKSLSLIKSYSKAYLEDRIDGSYDGVDYAMVEARLIDEDRDADGDRSDTQVFRGLLFRIKLPDPAPTTMLITRDYGKIGNKLAGMFSGKSGRGMPRVETGHGKFEDHFELHADDAEAALAYLPDAFLDNLMEIATTEADGGPKDLRASFHDDSLWLALGRSRPFLQMPSANKPVETLVDELHNVFEDLNLVRRIIAQLKT